MALLLMGLGPHRFYVPKPDYDTPNFETLSQESAFSWPVQPRLSRDMAAQFTGPGEEAIIIEGRLFPQVFGGISTLADLRDSGRAGAVMALVRFSPVDGSIISPDMTTAGGWMGDYIGKYYIKRVKRVESKIDSIGVANKIDFMLELGMFGDDVDQGNVSLFQ